jgi:hypothetical protein
MESFVTKKKDFFFLKKFISILYISKRCNKFTYNTSRIWILQHEFLLPRRRWEDNIKMDLQEVGGGCGDWMERAQDRDR